MWPPALPLAFGGRRPTGNRLYSYVISLRWGYTARANGGIIPPAFFRVLPTRALRVVAGTSPLDVCSGLWFVIHLLSSGLRHYSRFRVAVNGVGRAKWVGKRFQGPKNEIKITLSGLCPSQHNWRVWSGVIQLSSCEVYLPRTRHSGPLSSSPGLSPRVPPSFLFVCC